MDSILLRSMCSDFISMRFDSMQSDAIRFCCDMQIRFGSILSDFIRCDGVDERPVERSDQRSNDDSPNAHQS